LGDTAFSDVIVAAEAVRTGPHTDANWRPRRTFLEAVNHGDA
jgi:hypothetical protein